MIKTSMAAIDAAGSAAEMGGKRQFEMLTKPAVT